MTHGNPNPKKTFTELLPFTFPTELSAVFSIKAAVLLANVSGILVPRATRVIAVMGFGRPIKQPKIPAKSPIMAVRKPIIAREMINVGQPPRRLAGGINAKMI